MADRGGGFAETRARGGSSQLRHQDRPRAASEPGDPAANPRLGGGGGEAATGAGSLVAAACRVLRPGGGRGGDPATRHRAGKSSAEPGSNRNSR